MKARGWKPCRGWHVRARRHGGSEIKQKYATYEEAHAEASKLTDCREVWVEEADVVPRAFRDLEPRRQPSGPTDRAHVLNVEDDA